jgi:cytochrome c-type biogenesis protein CcmH
MMLYALMALLAFVAAAFVIAPLLRAAVARADAREAVFRRQLMEIDADVAAGLIAERDAAALRAEAERRLAAALRGADGAPFPVRARPLIGALLGLAAVAGAGALYVSRGEPLLPAAPPVKGAPDAAAVRERLAAHLAARPDDPDAHAAMGELLAMEAGGVVTPEARESFARALAGDGANIRALFFLGLEREQAGDAAGALAHWRPLVERAPADAPWADEMRQRVRQLEGEAAMASMSDEARAEMINGMVVRLAERLQEAPDDPEGWARLVTSYRVLGRAREEAQAIASARATLEGERLAAFEAMVAPQ